MLVTQDRFETLLLCHAMMTILVHFSAPHGRPHHPSVMKLYEVIKDMHPMHLELSNALSSILLAQFIQEILFLHGPFSWEKWAKALPPTMLQKINFSQKALWEIFQLGWFCIHEHAS